MLPLLAILGSAVTHPLAGACCKKALHPVSMSFWVIFFSTIPFVYELFNPKIWETASEHWPIIALGMLFHSAYGILLVVLLSRHAFQVTYPLTRTAPIIVAIGEIAFLHQLITFSQWLGIFAVAIGALLLSLDHKIKHIRREVWVLTSIIVICNAGILLCDKYLLEFFTVNQVWSFSIMEIIFNLFLVLLFKAPIKKELTQNLKFVLGGALFTLISWYLALYAMQYYPAAIASTIRNISIIIGIFIGGKFFAEGHMLKRYIAGLLIVAGAAVALL